MLSLNIDSWVNPVVNLFSGSGTSAGLYSEVVGCLRRLVVNIHRFYQSLTCFIQGFFHYFLLLFMSVSRLVLLGIHTTYNNKRLSIFKYLVINSRSY